MGKTWIAIVVSAATALATRTAHAQGTDLGAFFGPRFYADDAYLGYNEEQPYHPHLRTGPSFGARAGHPFGFSWLYPEVELVVVPTRTTKEGGADAASVVWVEPRTQLRFDLMPERRLNPFLLIGGGAPISLSSARKTFNSGVTGEGFFGAGIRFDTYKGFGFRFDARLAIQPGNVDAGGIAIEGDFNFGIELALTGKRRRNPDEQIVVAGPPPDRDGDGFPDKTDKCPDRAEDKDNFEDGDGCPEIDNDGDTVLDIADKCPTEQENLNGYADDDGCIDTIPADVESLRGTIEGLLYGDGETAVRDSAKRSIANIAKILATQPSVKIVLVGHTDDREAQAFVQAPDPSKPDAGPAPDIEQVAIDLAKARAEAVRQAIVSYGIPAGRIMVDGVGPDEPVSDNGTPRGRLANRRVEIKLYVPR
jgi:OOP family OmpA-OmpF porin